MKTILVLIWLCVASCANEESNLKQYIIVSETEDKICLKETENSEEQCYEKITYQFGVVGLVSSTNKYY